MPPDHDVDISVSLVRRLIAGQFPHWSSLDIRPVKLGGWDNRSFRLGEEFLVRLPSAARYAAQVEKEQTWLPRLAPFLPLAIPGPVAMGAPACGYPWRWSVYRWINGEPATIERIDDLGRFAVDLARFHSALQQIDPTDGPAPGPHNFFRGGPLSIYDSETRDAIATLDDRIDTRAAIALWETALDATWNGSPVWLHGDVEASNLLVRNGELTAVIDFGCAGVGDPACDLAIAWTFFSGPSRDAFCHALALDDETWTRGRGWALWKALITLAGRIDGASTSRTADAWRTYNEIARDFG